MFFAIKTHEYKSFLVNLNEVNNFKYDLHNSKKMTIYYKNKTESSLHGLPPEEFERMCDMIAPKELPDNL